MRFQTCLFSFSKTGHVAFTRAPDRCRTGCQREKTRADMHLSPRMCLALYTATSLHDSDCPTKKYASIGALRFTSSQQCARREHADSHNKDKLVRSTRLNQPATRCGAVFELRERVRESPVRCATDGTPLRNARASFRAVDSQARLFAMSPALKRQMCITFNRPQFDFPFYRYQRPIPASHVTTAVYRRVFDEKSNRNHQQGFTGSLYFSKLVRIVHSHFQIPFLSCFGLF